MNDTTDETAPVGGTPPGDPGPDSGHQHGQQAAYQYDDRRRGLDDLDQLRRSRTDRHVAGVAGGLGRHFGIDPTILRVLFVVLTFFGGAGLLVYAAVWLFVPEDGEARAPIEVNAEARKVLLIATAAVAVLLAVGDSLGGFTMGWPLALCALLVAGVLLAVGRRGPDRAQHPYVREEDDPMTTSYTRPAESAEAPVSPTGERGPGAGSPPYRQPPETGHRPAYQPPRRPRRTGIIWFWPTLALIAIGLGVLGVYDADHAVAHGAYPALALTIIGAMLVVGSFRGRPGGLILLGILASLSLAASTAVGDSFGTDARQIHAVPTTAAAVQPAYEASVGQIELDLTQVRNPAELAGRSIDLDLRTGEIRVIVPRGLNVDVEADIEFAGGISVAGDDGGGIGHSVDTYLAGVPATDAAPLELDLEAKFGQITVEQR
jgi:phage shock protein PspC (stress-responsive transcriptional regulator)